jgi:hypothetical protein
MPNGGKAAPSREREEYIQGVSKDTKEKAREPRMTRMNANRCCFAQERQGEIRFSKAGRGRKENGGKENAMRKEGELGSTKDTEYTNDWRGWTAVGADVVGSDRSFAFALMFLSSILAVRLMRLGGPFALCCHAKSQRAGGGPSFDAGVGNGESTATGPCREPDFRRLPGALDDEMAISECLAPKLPFGEGRSVFPENQRFSGTRSLHFPSPPTLSIAG